MGDLTNVQVQCPEKNIGFEVRVMGAPKGKGLFATKSYSSGDIIFEEKPLVCCQFLWNAAYGYAACSYCMHPLETAEENVQRLLKNSSLTLPHPGCCKIKKEEQCWCDFCGDAYCSVLCKNEAWNQFHKTLCLGQSEFRPNHPLVKLQDTWKQVHYPPETASIMLVARMISTIKQAKDQLGATNLFMQFCHRTVNEDEEIAHKLLGTKYISQLETLRALLTEALDGEDVQQWLTPDGFKSIMALIGTNSQGVGTSPLSVWVKNCDQLDLANDEREALDSFIDNLYELLDKEVGHFLNSEGSALYPLQSACNHSCVPNAMPSFPYNNFQLVMTAIKDIAVGEEICVSYLDECTLERSRHSRHKIMKENYLFTCHCPKCESQAEEPDVTSEDDMSDNSGDS